MALAKRWLQRTERARYRARRRKRGLGDDKGRGQERARKGVGTRRRGLRWLETSSRISCLMVRVLDHQGRGRACRWEKEGQRTRRERKELLFLFLSLSHFLLVPFLRAHPKEMNMFTIRHGTFSDCNFKKRSRSAKSAQVECTTTIKAPKSPAKYHL